MPKNKKFIDRKNAVTFHLVHRSQQDPLAADETAPQRVLLPVNAKPSKDKDKTPSKDKDKIIEEQQKYGIFFDDDYNYLQHLRDANKIEVEWEQVERNEPTTSAKLKLPSSVFASKVEENVGLLNKAAPHSGPRLDLDPDVIAALDDDFDYNNPENELEDNFMELANAEGGSDTYSNDEEEMDSDFNYSDEEQDEIGSLNEGQFTFTGEETKSRFTEYSMSSSVMRRNEQLTLLDDRFEKMYEAYDDGEIGPLDCEEIEGFVDPNSELVLQCVDQFKQQQKREKLLQDPLALRLAQIEDDEDANDNDEDLIKMEVKPQEKWDCESILSTYSNLYNRPKLITEPKKIQINPRTGMPRNILGQNKLTARNLSQLDEGHGTNGPKSFGGKSVLSQLSLLSIRPKDETPEQRKERKNKLKEYRKSRREEKKANAEAFKEEAKRQQKIAINNRNNIQGNRIL